MSYIDTLDQERQDKLHAKLPDSSDFEIYLALVDHIMGKTVGVTHRDIADWNWFDAFEGEVPPREAIQDALAEDDTYGVLFA